MKKFRCDVRSHLLMSLFAKHFWKIPKKAAKKRPLGVSLSCDLDERAEYARNTGGTRSPGKNRSHLHLNCLHCLMDVSSRELQKLLLAKKMQKAAMTGRLWSSFDSAAPGPTGTSFDSASSDAHHASFNASKLVFCAIK
ncbi:unnamed protein product [Gongylonema pulchrum]|nr:unnamed protein product [Gongylonema pulchrum]